MSGPNRRPCLQQGILLASVIGCAGLVSSAAGQSCGSGWVQRLTAGPSVSPRTLVYDEARQRVVLFGGHISGPPYYSGETWEWDGQVWLLRATTGPSARGRYSMAYDGAHVILFGGGTSASAPLGDTWQWDGAAGLWTQLFPSISPAARFDAAMAYDPIRQAIVLFGGIAGSAPIYRSDTWEWRRSSGTWTQQNISGPTPSYFGPFGAFDDSRSRVVIYIPGIISPFWTRDSVGNNPWTALATPFGPSNASGMTFDTARDRLVLVGSAPYPSPPGYGPLTWEMGPGNPAWELRSSSTPPGGSVWAPIVYDVARARTVLFGYYQTWEWDGLSSGPAIVSVPSQVWAQPGKSATISVSASGPGLSYQWRRYGQPLSNGGPFSGVQTPTLTIGPATLNEVSQYSVVVSNACGAVTSPPIGFQVTCPVNCDGSSGTPVLTGEDLICFIIAYASNASYANCDGSTGSPRLTANDLMCFFTKLMSQDCSAW